MPVCCRLESYGDPPIHVLCDGLDRVELLAPRCPFIQTTLRHERERAGYPKELNDLGDHIRRRIMDLGINQKIAARHLGVIATSVTNWLKRRRAPDLRHWPKVIKFLGYDPRPVPQGTGPALVHWREMRGLSQKKLAARLRIDPTTLARWERGERDPAGLYLARIRALLGQC
jgi:DNA-binding transcriptional regulator YiaG